MQHVLKLLFNVLVLVGLVVGRVIFGPVFVEERMDLFFCVLGWWCVGVCGYCVVRCWMVVVCVGVC